MIDKTEAREYARQYGRMGALFGAGVTAMMGGLIALYQEGRELYANLRHFDPASIGLVATEIGTAALSALVYGRMSYDGELRRQGIYKS